MNITLSSFYGLLYRKLFRSDLTSYDIPKIYHIKLKLLNIDFFFFCNIEDTVIIILYFLIKKNAFI